MSRYRNWCFTENNPEGFLYPETWDNCTYCVYQEEMSETGTYHLQGYAEFSVRLRLQGVKDCSGMQGAHFDRRRGTAKQAAHYCKKPVPGCLCNHCVEASERIGGPYEFGEITGQGNRSDLSDAKEAIDEGTDMVDMWQDHFSTMVRYHRSMELYKRITVSKRAWVMDIQVYTGPTGTGKTRRAYDDYPDLYMVPQTKMSGTYWDDYDGQETVLVDEMYGNRFSWGFLLQLCDRYPMKVPIHGGFVEFTSRRIVFTSNVHPGLWYKSPFYMWDDLNPLRRRVSTHLEFPLDAPVPMERDGNLALLGNPIVLVGVSNAAVAIELERRERDRQVEEYSEDE